MTPEEKVELTQDVIRALEPVLNKAFAPILAKIRAQKGKLSPEDSIEVDQILETIMEGLGNWAEEKAQELERMSDLPEVPLRSSPSDTGADMPHSNMR